LSPPTSRSGAAAARSTQNRTGATRRIFFALLFGAEPEPLFVRAMDLALILHADHELKRVDVCRPGDGGDPGRYVLGDRLGHRRVGWSPPWRRERTG